MASTLPTKLKIPSITPFATRAHQLEKFRPIIAYWCNYHVVNQILSLGLHNADEECLDYTTTLMNKLETAKNETPPVDAIVDDIAARAYVEQFALETFQRADTAIHSDQASRQTIDTFQAASTFLELIGTWAPLDSEITSKIKYAKYHALRIAKALKAGQDPNATNPKDETPDAATPGLSNEGPTSLGTSSAYHQPTVESVPDSKLPSRSISVPPGQPMDLDAPPPIMTSASSLAAAAPTNGEAPAAVEYFPPVPDVASTPAIAPPGDLQSSQDYYTQPLQPPAATFNPPPVANVPSVAPASIPRQSQPQSVASGGYRTDDESVAQAQKHAKWAQSALNFEDVPTAVKELRLALQFLGAS